jgi:hypothetical protein
MSVFLSMQGRLQIKTKVYILKYIKTALVKYMWIHRQTIPTSLLTLMILQ